MTEAPDTFPTTLSLFADFINSNLDRLVRHAFFKLGNLQEAEDVVQNILIRVFQERERYAAVDSPLAYIMKMVSNACIDKLRNDLRVPTVPINGSAEAHAMQGVSREGEMIREEEFRRINALLASIPFEQSEVIRLKVVDELSFVEIARFMDLPVTTVKSRFKYGLDKMKNQLSGKEEVRHEM
jgi:RNA polymerase sigma-70 factor, ECF subfamily